MQKEAARLLRVCPDVRLDLDQSEAVLVEVLEVASTLGEEATFGRYRTGR
jgi:hypothetical protein